MQTSLFVFSSNRPRHIPLAVQHGIWKIHCSKQQQAPLFGKAEGRIFQDDKGVFYDSLERRLTVPFVFTSEVEYTLDNDPFDPIDGEPYLLQFSISPQGPISRSIPYEVLPQKIQKAVNPLLVFQPCEIEDDEWGPMFDLLRIVP